jgi:hypothetical protein
MGLTPARLVGVQKHVPDARFDYTLIITQTRDWWLPDVVSKGNETSVVSGRAEKVLYYFTQVTLRHFLAVTRTHGS